jgi:hypothetical protein
MSSFQLPPVAGVPTLSTVERAAVLDALFEPCQALHTLSVELLYTEKFESYNDLISSVGIQLIDLSESPSTSDTEWLDKILGAHPRLGEKKVESAQSQAEQAQLNTRRLFLDSNTCTDPVSRCAKLVSDVFQCFRQRTVPACHHGRHAVKDRQR